MFGCQYISCLDGCSIISELYGLISVTFQRDVATWHKSTPVQSQALSRSYHTIRTESSCQRKRRWKRKGSAYTRGCQHHNSDPDHDHPSGCGAYYNLRTCGLCSFFLKDTATTEIYTLSLHDALPI